MLHELMIWPETSGSSDGSTVWPETSGSSDSSTVCLQC